MSGLTWSPYHTWKEAHVLLCLVLFSSVVISWRPLFSERKLRRSSPGRRGRWGYSRSNEGIETVICTWEKNLFSINQEPVVVYIPNKTQWFHRVHKCLKNNYHSLVGGEIVKKITENYCLVVWLELLLTREVEESCLCVRAQQTSTRQYWTKVQPYRYLSKLFAISLEKDQKECLLSHKY